MRCQNRDCNVQFVDRDKNSARNIAKIGYFVFAHKQRPVELTPPSWLLAQEELAAQNEVPAVDGEEQGQQEQQGAAAGAAAEAAAAAGGGREEEEGQGARAQAPARRGRGRGGRGRGRGGRGAGDAAYRPSEDEGGEHD
jgi:hypothetical protein